MEASSYTTILKEPGLPVYAYDWNSFWIESFVFWCFFSVLRCPSSAGTSHTWHRCALGPNLATTPGHWFSTPEEQWKILKLRTDLFSGKSRRKIYCCFSQFQDYSFALLIQIPGFSIEFINHKLVSRSPWCLCIFDVLLLAEQCDGNGGEDPLLLVVPRYSLVPWNWWVLPNSFPLIIITIITKASFRDSSLPSWCSSFSATFPLGYFLLNEIQWYMFFLTVFLLAECAFCTYNGPTVWVLSAKKRIF